MINCELKYHGVTETIIGVFYDVYNELGFGFLESVYESAMHLALAESKLIRVHPRGSAAGKGL